MKTRLSSLFPRESKRCEFFHLTRTGLLCTFGSWYWCVLSKRYHIRSPSNYQWLDYRVSAIQGKQERNEGSVRASELMRLLCQNVSNFASQHHRVFIAQADSAAMQLLSVPLGEWGKCKPIEMHSKPWEIWCYSDGVAEEAYYVECEVAQFHAEWFFMDYLTLEYEGNSVLRDLGNHSTKDVVWNPIRLEHREQLNQRCSLISHKTLTYRKIQPTMRLEIPYNLNIGKHSTKNSAWNPIEFNFEKFNQQLRLKSHKTLNSRKLQPTMQLEIP